MLGGSFVDDDNMYRCDGFAFWLCCCCCFFFLGSGLTINDVIMTQSNGTKFLYVQTQYSMIQPKFQSRRVLYMCVKITHKTNKRRIWRALLVESRLSRFEPFSRSSHSTMSSTDPNDSSLAANTSAVSSLMSSFSSMWVYRSLSKRVLPAGATVPSSTFSTSFLRERISMRWGRERLCCDTTWLKGYWCISVCVGRSSLH